MIALKESLLSKTKDKVANVPSMVDEELILDKLINSGWYLFQCPKDKIDSSLFKIYKQRNKYFVDVNCGVTCIGTPEGMITDGTFRFGKINGEFIIVPSSQSRKKSQLKSLEFGPIDVETFNIFDNEQLKDLKGCPKYVRSGGVLISDTNITSLKYFPIYVGGNIYITHNEKLKSVSDTKFCNVEGLTVVFKSNGFVSSELTKRELNWTMLNVRHGFRFDKSIAAPEFNK